MNVKRIGLDLAKNVFELYGVDEHDQRVLSKSVRRGKLLETFARLPPCVVGMEACGGAHHWARELWPLGHEPRLMALQSIAIYGKNDKNDRNDEAPSALTPRSGRSRLPGGAAQRSRSIARPDDGTRAGIETDLIAHPPTGLLGRI